MSAAHLLFLRDFDEELASERRLSEAGTDTWSEEAVEAALTEARRAAFEQGFAAGQDQGRAEALASLDGRRVEMIEGLATAIGRLVDERSDHIRRLEDEMTDFVHDVGQKVVPEFVSALGARRAREEIGRIVRRAIGSPFLEIRVARDLAGDLAQDLLADAASRDGIEARVVSDPSLPPTEVRATWRHGRSRYAFAAVCRSVLSILSGPPAVPTAPAGATIYDQ